MYTERYYHQLLHCYKINVLQPILTVRLQTSYASDGPAWTGPMGLKFSLAWSDQMSLVQMTKNPAQPGEAQHK